MSDVLNHYFCANEIYNDLHNRDIKRIIKKYYEAYRLGSQGSDFFYYNFFLKGAKTSKQVGSLIHTQNINKFFYYGLKFAQKNPMYREITLAYLLGFLTHLQLDSITHPFIFYKTGTDSDDLVEIVKSKSLHKFFEVLLDTAMAQYEYSKLAVNLNPEKVFYVNPYTLKFLESFYHYVLKEVFDIDLEENGVKLALNNAAFFVNLMKDQSGLKHFYLGILERLISPDKLITHYLYPSYTNEFDILNIDHNPWKHPVTGEIQNDSYPELFEKAVRITPEKFEAFFKLFNSEAPELQAVDQIIHDTSYLTGVTVKEDQQMKYFDEAFKENLLKNY